jgi:2',3'-cyclic-nucleotide 2'-phosphodiesterase (5'-nucleotidase family)
MCQENRPYDALEVFLLKRLLRLTATLLLAALMILLAFSGCGPVTPEQESAGTAPIADLVIIHTNDTHGRALYVEEREIGFALVAAEAERLRQAGERVLMLDAGDTFHGTAMASLHKGESIVEFMNKAGYALMTPGNHDFNYGADRLIELAAMADFSLIVANVRNDTGPLFPPYEVIDYGDLKVGVIGLITTETYFKANPAGLVGIFFDDPIKAARSALEELSGENVDLVIALTHLGLDLESDAVSSRQLAEAVEGIDIIIDGHSHHRLLEGEWVNNTLIVQTGSHSSDIGMVRISFPPGDLRHISASLIDVTGATSLDPEPQVAAEVERYNALNEPILQEIVSYSSKDLVGERELVRTGQTNLGDAIVAAMLLESGADVAMINGGSIRTSIAAGPVSRGDLIAVLPFGNTTAVIEVTGAELVAMLENGLSGYPEPSGAFPQVGGLTYSFNSEAEPGVRSSGWIVSDRPLDPEAKYLLVTTDFLLAGGDNYEMLKGKRVLFEYGTVDELLSAYMAEQYFFDNGGAAE